MEPILQQLTAIANPAYGLEGRLREAQDLCAAGEADAALRITEEVLHQESGNLGARLMWVRCQLEIGSLPLSALSAPLEELASQLEIESRFLLLSCATFLLLGSRLLERGQSRLALLMFERARALTPQSNVDEKHAIEHVLSEAIEQEIKRSENRNERKEYIEGLRKQLAEIGSAKGNNHENAAAPRSRSPLSAKAILDEQFSESEGPPAAAGQSASPVGAARPRHYNSSFAIRVGALILTVALFVLLLAIALRDNSPETLAKLTFHTTDTEKSDLTLPQLSPMVPTNNESLDNLKARLDSLSFKNENQNQAKEQAGENAATSSNEKPTAEPSPTPDSAKLPELDPQHLPQTPVENLNLPSSPPPASERPSFPPQAGARGPHLPGRTTLDGGPVQAYEVQRFEPPLIYRILVDTEVLQAPSVYAHPVGHLHRDDRIRVNSAMGEWLEIYSQGGRRGFIFAQDAEELRR